MAFNLSAWSIKKPIPSVMLFGALTILGLLSFKALPVQDFPDIELPVVTVSLSLPGATPSQLETEVTRKVEDAVASLGKVTHVRSTLVEGSSTTSIEFALEKNNQEAVDEVRDAVSRIRGQLPADVGEPQVAKVNAFGQAVVAFSVESAPGLGLTKENLSWFVDNTVSKELLAVKDVSSVVRQGGVSREVQVQLDPAKMKSLNLTSAQVSGLLKQVQQELGAGTAQLGGSGQAIRAVGTVDSVEALGRLKLPLGDGRYVTLNEFARVSDTEAQASQTALVDGVEVVSFQVFRSKGASDVSVADAVRKRVSELAAANPSIKVAEVSNNVDRIKSSFEGSMSSLYEGAALAIVVVWLFLRDWRATFVSAIALPLSVIPTFYVLDAFLGFSLNTITLLALTLVVGILVDDAIVEVENIVRHLRMGKPPMQAAADAAQEIGLAVVATTLTLVAVFLPTAFMGGIPGKFFKQFGWTASIAVLASLMVARLLTPMMAAYMLKAHPEPKSSGVIMNRYLQGVRWCLGNPAKTVFAALAFFAASLVLMARIPTEFMAQGSNGRVMVNVELAPGSLFTDTVATAELARKALSGIPEVSSVYTSVGTGATRNGGTSTPAEVRTATLTLNLKPEGEGQRSQTSVEAEVRTRLAKVAGARFTLGMGQSGEKYSVTLAGEDATALTTTADALEAGLRTIPGLGNTSSSASLVRPEIVITPKADRAAEAGVSVQAMAQAVRVATAGDFDTNLAKLNLPERQLPIRVWMGDTARLDLDVIGQIRLPSKMGTVALESVADLRMDSGPAQISRQDRMRNVTVSVDLNGERLGPVAEKVAQLEAMKTMPPTVHLLPSGDLERMKELFGSFGMAMAAGVLCVYVVLVLLFGSFSQPLTILSALPLSAGGAFGALALFDYSMSVSVLIGLLMLMGVVTKNSILLVEYAVMAQKEKGMSRTEAIVDACSKRAQPIVMTTVAMAAGMVPIALGYNGDAAFRSPMATAVIGGLLTSTLLSLLAVPVVYELVDAANALPSRVWRRVIRKS